MTESSARLSSSGKSAKNAGESGTAAEGSLHASGAVKRGSETKPRAPSAIEVAAYLRANPDFFLEHEALLTELRLPHESGAAISLIEKQVAVFRAQRDSYEQQLNSLIETARENDQLFNKSKRLLTSLLEARTLDEILVVLQDGFLRDFRVDFCSLIVFDDAIQGASARSGARASNVQRSTANAAGEALEDMLSVGRVSFGRLTAKQREYLFPVSSEAVGSCAVIPLQYESPLGVLSIGSRKEDYFDSSMGSMFLTYIADTLSRLLPPLLYKESMALRSS
ncbi:DUF484 family protein [Allohahella marinimesophila]|uniref:DUF484 family protein n=1 Tax=Allohahella marinimesophila TaxID=1054972 RepID=A0ABP7P717_9GAMM